MEELWKLFPLDTRYEVSTLGRIKRRSTQKIRVTPIKQNGYPGVVFTYKGGKPKGYDVHTMVALTWLGPRPPGFDVSHQDGIKTNNCISNLVYESRKENANKSFNKFRSRVHKYALTAEDVYYIRQSAETNNHLARKFSVGRAAIWKIRNGYTWKWLK